MMKRIGELKAEVERLTERNQHLEQIDSYLQSANLNAEEQRSIELEAENARLKAEVERLTKAGDAMASGLQGMAGERPKALADEWHDAKEGKQS
jgi:DNA-binding transcriptional MerR regulator